VGVYATNIKSELFLRQFAGRFVRGQQSATLYIPAVEPITIFARQIKEERDHVLAQAIHLPDPPVHPAQSGHSAEQPFAKGSTFTPLGSTSLEHDTIYNGESFTVEELKYAWRLKQELHLPLDAPVIAALLRRHDSNAGVFVIHQEPAAETLPAVDVATSDVSTETSALSHAEDTRTRQPSARVSCQRRLR
jgi:hypothetical protein